MARKRESWSTTVAPELLEKLRELSENSRIPISKLTDEALEDLLIKHKAIKPKAAPKKPPAKKPAQAGGGDPQQPK